MEAPKTAAHAANISNNPLMPPAKQQRILIWRTEVASALSLPTSSHSSDTTTTSVASPLPDDITINDDPRPTPEHAILGSPLSPTTSSSKARSFWKRISWRFSRHRRGPSSLAPDAQRTSMYRNDRPIPVVDDLDGAFQDRHSDDGANALRDKQERMQRAARLLNQGVREDAGAAVINAQRSRNGQHTVA
ncbi:hypothetical protein B0T10DRAFT_556296 [Thelonectria olida]|uniref:Uncharacterized protein n=1 Tax=Thelonectria olida TaxID=1576542 RepID=A0A9P8WHD1_9HYPO|nr:hypothetical protein B0T10DRAFT_556296 [Thelonectria olida]